ncbi:MAG TPA: TonB family protein [Thermoanaerobaculia bacterium]|nr:TonB family protein [Thermoanaerobaculia bacterium]
MTTEKLPRAFGPYRLRAILGEDALGAVFRATRTAEPGSFAILRILESPELDAEPILSAIEENGEIHEFLKHAAIARGVDMDAVDGTPYVAWSQPNGRTLDALIGRCRALNRRMPVEHALLIAEKIATALDYAYNTTIEGDRTLHGMVWPGFVALSDDGEIRLAGFGLSAGILPALVQPGVGSLLSRYVAPEERSQGTPGKSSDVYSVGVILLEMLTGQKAPADPLAFVKGVAGAPPPPVVPEILAILRMALAPAETRYRTSGDLRRELGKLLFSGPYSPSTFNLAYFLNELFRNEIEAETRARLGEGGKPEDAVPLLGRAAARDAAREDPVAEPREPSVPAAAASRKGPLAAIFGLIAVAAVAGGVYVVSRRPSAPAPTAFRSAPEDVRPTPTLLPELAATPADSTSGMSEAQFREEVARRLAVEVQKLETAQARKASAAPPPERVALVETPRPAVVPAYPTAVPATPAPTPTEPLLAAKAEPTAAPALPTPPPARAAAREGALVALEDVDSPPRVARIVKPVYPPLALQARIGGIVVLRVLVSEKGTPAEIEVAREGRSGLTEAAVRAVRGWTFDPAVKDGVPVRTWISVPIPFQP